MSIFHGLKTVDKNVDIYEIESGLIIFNQTRGESMFLKYIFKPDNINLYPEKNKTVIQTDIQTDTQTDTQNNTQINNQNNTQTDTQNASNNSDKIIIECINDLNNRKINKFGLDKYNQFILNNKDMFKNIMSNNVFKIEILRNSLIIYQELNTNENKNNFDSIINNNIKLIVRKLINMIKKQNNNEDFEKNIYITYCENNSKYCTHNVYEDSINNINLKLCD